MTVVDVSGLRVVLAPHLDPGAGVKEPAENPHTVYVAQDVWDQLTELLKKQGASE